MRKHILDRKRRVGPGRAQHYTTLDRVRAVGPQGRAFATLFRKRHAAHAKRSRTRHFLRIMSGRTA